ncbi:MAG: hypothetical protein G01um101430_640 [Parcubacteria group bacterium Gr01-1014_30]|nr:MAG: hypothetical protein G01um101430_640 [Parcubacteria group bacterium Gr01-1014_30]
MAIVGFLLSANLKINKKRSQLVEQINYLENQVRELEEQEAQYERGLLQAETDEFWEERLREHGYKKPGEEVFVVVQPEEAESVQVQESKSFWQRLRERIGL